MRCGEADPADAVDLGDRMDQETEIRDGAIEHRAAVGVDVLAKQVDLAHALFGQCRDFGDDIVEGPADFLSAHVRHDAERAVFGAAFHDRDERAGTFRARFGQVVEFLDLGE